MAVNTEPENVTANTTLSLEAHEMLRVTGKNHLRDVTDEEWSRYAAQHTVSETLCAEFWSWRLPDQGFLELISGREGARAQIEYWETVRQRSPDHQVHAHAVNQIKILGKGVVQLFCLSSSGIIGGRHEYERTGKRPSVVCRNWRCQ